MERLKGGASNEGRESRTALQPRKIPIPISSPKGQCQGLTSGSERFGGNGGEQGRRGWFSASSGGVLCLVF